MEIITMESAAYKDIVGRIEEIASHVRKQGMEGLPCIRSFIRLIYPAAFWTAAK